MSKKIKIVAVSLMIILILSLNISYAEPLQVTSSFFEVNKKEIANGEVLEMIIDLSKIENEKFKINISANIQMENAYLEQNTNLNVNVEDSDISIEIDKTTLNLSKLVIYYPIDNFEIGTVVKLNAKVIVTETEEPVDIMEESQNVKIIEKNMEEENNKEDDKSEENVPNKVENENNKPDNENNGNRETYDMLNQNKNQILNQNTTSSNIQNFSSNEIKEEATYNGSCNNYLSKIVIENGDLTIDFYKEKTTYFLTTTSLDKIDITAVAEDSASIVNITGTELKEGQNKILISVTAENGDVRYYRIYVTNIKGD